MYDVNRNTAPDNILKVFCRISSVHTYNIHVLQPLNIFILKNLDSMSNEMISWVLGSKFGMVPQILKERSVKALLLDNLQTEDFYNGCRNNYCENEKVILLSFYFQFTSFLKFTPIFSS